MSVYKIYVDGCSRGQGADPDGLGEGACAIVMYKNDKQIGQYARALGRVTNNQAEYEAVLMAIQAGWFANLDSPIIYSDSQTVVNQVTNKWQCKSPNLYPLYLSTQEIREVYFFNLQQVPRREIHQADYLANQMLDLLKKKRESLFQPIEQERSHG